MRSNWECYDAVGTFDVLGCYNMVGRLLRVDT